MFVWFKQCQHQHAAAWSNSGLLARAAVKRHFPVRGTGCVRSRGWPRSPHPGRPLCATGSSALPPGAHGRGTGFPAGGGGEGLLVSVHSLFCLCSIPPQEPCVFVLTLKNQQQKKYANHLGVSARSMQVFSLCCV